MLTSQLDSRAANCEALKARVSELEAQLARKDMHMADQKRALKAVKEECRELLEVRLFNINEKINLYKDLASSPQFITKFTSHYQGKNKKFALCSLFIEKLSLKRFKDLETTE